MSTENNIYAKVMRVQQEVGSLSKDKKNPFFNSKYFDINQVLEQLMPILIKHNLTTMQPLTNIDGQAAIKTIIADCESGEFMHDTIPLPLNTDPQKNGSAITYYRRYALVSAFGLQAEDDDANHASNGAPAKAQKSDDNRPWLNTNTKEWDAAVKYLKDDAGTIAAIEKKYKLSKGNKELLMQESI